MLEPFLFAVTDLELERTSMITKSKTQTQKFAKKLAQQILKKGQQKQAQILALSGDLGAGKTTFTQGFIKALGVKHRVTSPTFMIVRRYELKNKKFLNVFHFDLYRIHQSKEILSLDFRKIIKNPENIVLIEWPERIKKLLPKNAAKISFDHGKNQKERIIRVKS